MMILRPTLSIVASEIVYNDFQHFNIPTFSILDLVFLSFLSLSYKSANSMGQQSLFTHQQQLLVYSFEKNFLIKKHYQFFLMHVSLDYSVLLIQKKQYQSLLNDTTNDLSVFAKNLDISITQQAQQVVNQKLSIKDQAKAISKKLPFVAALMTVKQLLNSRFVPGPNDQTHYSDSYPTESFMNTTFDQISNMLGFWSNIDHTKLKNSSQLISQQQNEIFSIQQNSKDIPKVHQQDESLSQSFPSPENSQLLNSEQKKQIKQIDILPIELKLPKHEDSYYMVLQSLTLTSFQKNNSKPDQSKGFSSLNDESSQKNQSSFVSNDTSFPQNSKLQSSYNDNMKQNYSTFDLDSSLSIQQPKDVIKFDSQFPTLKSEDIHILNQTDSMPYIKTIFFDNYQIQNDKIRILIQNGQKLPNLKCIIFGKNTISYEGFQAFCQNLHKFTKLKNFSVHNNMIKDQGLILFVQKANQLVNLTDFQVDYCGITGTGAKRFFELAGNKFPQLNMINLSGNKISNQGMKAFGQHGYKLEKLVYIDLSSNSIDYDGMIAFAQSLTNIPKLELMMLEHNPITDKGFLVLAEQFIKMPNLKYLMFEQNNFTDRAIEYMIQNFDKFRQINQMTFSNNNITDRGINLLKQNSHLFPQLDVDLMKR